MLTSLFGSVSGRKGWVPSRLSSPTLHQITFWQALWSLSLKSGRDNGKVLKSKGVCRQRNISYESETRCGKVLRHPSPSMHVFKLVSRCPLFSFCHLAFKTALSLANLELLTVEHSRASLRWWDAWFQFQEQVLETWSLSLFVFFSPDHFYVAKRVT